jgi:IS30 family transposase
LDQEVLHVWRKAVHAAAKSRTVGALEGRHTRFAMLIKVDGKDTESVVGALAKQVRRLPSQLRRSLTWDRGKEMADHKRFTLATDVKVYSATREAPGSVAATRTPTACCASTSLKAGIYRDLPTGLS